MFLTFTEPLSSMVKAINRDYLYNFHITTFLSENQLFQQKYDTTVGPFLTRQLAVNIIHKTKPKKKQYQIFARSSNQNTLTQQQ